MTSQNIFQKIKDLPEELLDQVSDYIDFLMMKNRIELNPSGEITSEDRKILDDRYKEIQGKNSELSKLVDVKNEMLKKYGK